MLWKRTSSITARQLQVLVLVAKGYKSIEIAETLQLSKHTVDNHRKNMLKKSGTSNSMELVLWAKRNGLLG